MERMSGETGKRFKDLTFDEMHALWLEAKAISG